MDRVGVGRYEEGLTTIPEHLRAQTAEWAEFSAAVSRILLPAT